MSRIKTKGRTIPVQLALPLDAELRAIAARAGMTPGVWLSWFVTVKLNELRQQK